MTSYSISLTQNVRFLSAVTLAPSLTSFSLQISNRVFRHASPCLFFRRHLASPSSFHSSYLVHVIRQTNIFLTTLFIHHSFIRFIIDCRFILSILFAFILTDHFSGRVEQSVDRVCLCVRTFSNEMIFNLTLSSFNS